MAQGDVYRTNWVFTHPNISDNMITSLDFRLSSIVTPLSEPEYCQQIADEVNTIIDTNYLTLIPSTVTHVRTEAVNISSNLAGCEVVSGQTGFSSGEAVSLRNAPVISKKTGLRGRSNQGRMFLMPVTEPQQTGGVLASAYVGALQTFIDLFKTVTLANGNIYLATVYSQKLLLDNPIESFVVRSVQGTQRSRQQVK